MERREQIQSMLEADPTDPFLLYALAMEDRKDGHLDVAVRGLERVLSQNEQYVAAYFQKAQILHELGETETACQALKDGIAMARKVGDDHAASEMEGFLEMIE